MWCEGSRSWNVLKSWNTIHDDVDIEHQLFGCSSSCRTNPLELQLNAKKQTRTQKKLNLNFVAALLLRGVHSAQTAHCVSVLGYIRRGLLFERLLLSTPISHHIIQACLPRCTFLYLCRSQPSQWEKCAYISHSFSCCCCLRSFQKQTVWNVKWSARRVKNATKTNAET